jgi:hypothetical protein
VTERAYFAGKVQVMQTHFLKKIAHLPRKLLVQRVQSAFHGLRVWMVRVKFL